MCRFFVGFERMWKFGLDLQNEWNPQHWEVGLLSVYRVGNVNRTESRLTLPCLFSAYTPMVVHRVIVFQHTKFEYMTYEI